MESLKIRDKAIMWHPFTQEQTAELPIVIKKANGSYLYDENDKAYLDLISSWWVNLHGHSHPFIAKSIYDQAMKLEHVIFAGFTHESAVTICENLRSILPQNLMRFFFSDNGSTSVEVALKMAYQFWKNKGERNRNLFLSFDGGYHGDTFGAMSVGKGSRFHLPFVELFFSVNTFPFPYTWEGDREIEIKEDNALSKVSNFLKKNAQHCCAFIMEPLIQGASGMKMCRPSFIDRVVNLVREFNILIIFDEVMTGFGRTGTHFAFQQTSVVPDFLCLSKGLTGGFLPLALTVTTQDIFDAFLGEADSKSFLHGHSYTANPLGCAAGIASLELLKEEKTQNAIKNIQKAHLNGIKFLKENQHIKNHRICGTVSAFDVDDQMFPNISQKIKNTSLNNGLIIRPLGKTIYFLPPYSTTIKEIENAYFCINETVSDICK